MSTGANTGRRSYKFPITGLTKYEEIGIPVSWPKKLMGTSTRYGGCGKGRASAQRGRIQFIAGKTSSYLVRLSGIQSILREASGICQRREPGHEETCSPRTPAGYSL